MHGLRLNCGILQRFLARRLATAVTFSSTDFLDKTGITYSKQSSLPRLPVPDLDSSTSDYLEQVKFIVPSAYNHAVKLVKQSEDNGQLRKLHDLLIQRAKERESWLSEWWLNHAILESRFPVTVTPSPGLKLPTEKFNSPDDWLSHAAAMAYGCCDFITRVDNREVSVDTSAGEPLCMSQYRVAFYTMRYPGHRRDSLINYRPEPGEPAHFCVSFRHRIYAITFRDDIGKLIDPLNLKQCLHHIVASAPSGFASPAVGALTNWTRSEWHAARGRLAELGDNARILEALSSSAFLLCLDESLASTEDDDTCLAGAIHASVPVSGGAVDLPAWYKTNAGNRWYDKTIQIVVGRSGMCSLTFEHGPSEGPLVARTVGHIYNYLDGNRSSFAVASEVPQSPPPELRLTDCDWTVDSGLEDDINSAMKMTTDDADRMKVKYGVFDAIGKRDLKKLKVSPDAFIQVAFQLAFCELHAVACASYESGSTKRFSLGRTGVIRAVTPEVDRLCWAACRGRSDGTRASDLGVLLRAACEAHSRRTRQVCAEGRGFDRHWVGLRSIGLETGLPVPAFVDHVFNGRYDGESHIGDDLSDDVAVEKLREIFAYRISTSQVPLRVPSVTGFGPSVYDYGYGLCYNPMPDNIIVSISTQTSKEGVSGQASNEKQLADLPGFTNALSNAFGHMRSWLEKM